ncbi:MAG: hypothetical protein J6D57_05890, partial [Mogibacterium sp.]|nr:hypothetical protein [Mogibacterium sp.]
MKVTIKKVWAILMCMLVCVSTLQLPAFAESDLSAEAGGTNETVIEQPSARDIGEENASASGKADTSKADPSEQTGVNKDEKDTSKTETDTSSKTENQSKNEDAAKVSDDSLDADKTDPSNDIAVKYPAFNSSAKASGMTVSVSADKGVFPEGSTLSVKRIALTDAQKKAVRAERDKDKRIAASYSFDIKVMDKDGKELQPADSKKVEVTFAVDEASNSNLEANIYHHESAGSVDKLDTEISNGEVSTETTGFSVYTVEFSYGNLEYVLDGDSEVKLSEILKTLGITGEVTNAVSSNDKLFKAEKRSGEWIVKAVKAFTSEETLTVTVDGIDMIIKVTDAQTISVSTASEWTAAINTANNSSDETEIQLTGSFTLPALTTITGKVKLTGAGTLTFNWNGSSYQTGTSGAPIRVNGGTLTIDSEGITISPPSGTGGGLFWIDSGGSVVLNNGTIDYGNQAAYDKRRIIVVQNGSSFVMNGGTIQNYRMKGNAFLIDAESGGSLRMTGGSIKNVAAESSQGIGAIQVSGSFEMTGGSFDAVGIKNGDINGGSAVVVRSGGVADISGGTFSGNGADSGSGGAINVSSGATLNLSGNTKISGNT